MPCSQLYWWSLKQPLEFVLSSVIFVISFFCGNIFKLCSVIFIITEMNDIMNGEILVIF